LIQVKRVGVCERFKNKRVWVSFFCTQDDDSDEEDDIDGDEEEEEDNDDDQMVGSSDEENEQLAVRRGRGRKRNRRQVTHETRRERADWEAKRQELLFHYSQFRFHAPPVS
jgi:hypothetical protein